jgi:hypothetical protein
LPPPAQIFIRVIQDPFKLKIEKREEKKSGMRNGRYKCAHLRLSASIFFSQINADLFLANFRRSFPANNINFLRLSAFFSICEYLREMNFYLFRRLTPIYFSLIFAERRE